MDSERFDQVTKHLSRRRVTKGLLAGGAAGIFALLRSQPSHAQSCRGECHKTYKSNRFLARLCIALSC
jgi:hypothetical protein